MFENKKKSILSIIIFWFLVISALSQQHKNSHTIIFQETFGWEDTTAPQGWILPDNCYFEDPLNNGFNWHWWPNDSLVSDRIAEPPFQSTSKEDGHLCLFGGLYNIYRDLPDCQEIRNSILFTGIDCSRYPSVIMQFETNFQNYGWHGYDYLGWDCFVEVSGDNGIHWAMWDASFEVFGSGRPVDVAPGEPALFRANLSGVGGGQENVIIRFTWHAGVGIHFWIIDDLKLIEAYPNDLYIDKVDVIWDDRLDGTEESISYMMPYSQLASGHGFHVFKSYVTNMGANEAENLKLEVTIQHDGNRVFQETKTLPYVSPGFKDSLILDGRYEPTEKGEYAIKYKWTQDAVDYNPFDNEKTIYCYFSDSVYNRAGDQPEYSFSYNYYRSRRDDWDLHANLEHSMGSIFPIYQDCELDGISAYITGGLADGLIDFCYTIWQADHYELTGGIVDPNRLMFTEYLQLDSSMFNTWVYLPYDKDGETEFIKAGTLLWTGVQYNNWHEDEAVRRDKGLSIGATNKLPHHDARSIFSNPNEFSPTGWGWSRSERNLMMRLYLHSTGTSSEPFIIEGFPLTMSQNYPNPFSDKTNIIFILGKEAPVYIHIKDVLGKTVFSKYLGRLQVGEHSTIIDSEDLSPGIYFYTLNAEQTGETKKMIVE